MEKDKTRGRPKSENPKVRVHITIDPNLRDRADEFGRSKYFNAAAAAFEKTPAFRKFKRQCTE